MKPSEKLDSVKQEIEHLELQLALGKAEAADKFEEKKKAMKAVAHQAKLDLGKVEGKGKELAESLKADMEHLQVQLALGKMESMDKYKEFEGNSKSVVEGLSTKAHELMEIGEGKYEEMGASLKEKATEFKTQMEVFRLQLALGEAEAKEEYEEKKKKFLHEAKSLTQTINETLASAEGKVEEIGDKVYEEFKELKNKFFG
ncbi:MAG: hypothetical protein ACI85I_001824 [Arenicella sp.]|jgi:hypothetical protein